MDNLLSMLPRAYILQRFQYSAPPLAKKTAGQIEKETFEFHMRVAGSGFSSFFSSYSCSSSTPLLFFRFRGRERVRRRGRLEYLWTCDTEMKFHTSTAAGRKRPVWSEKKPCHFGVISHEVSGL